MSTRFSDLISTCTLFTGAAFVGGTYFGWNGAVGLSALALFGSLGKRWIMKLLGAVADAELKTDSYRPA